jgi:hypothetical protein
MVNSVISGSHAIETGIAANTTARVLHVVARRTTLSSTIGFDHSIPKAPPKLSHRGLEPAAAGGCINLV